MPNQLSSPEPLGKRLMKRAAVATVVSAALVGVNERIDSDRVFHQDRGNPANAAQIVDSWNMPASEKEQPIPVASTGEYRFRQGDTRWGVAKKVERNQDGIAGD